jgi:hypothetical protein
LNGIEHVLEFLIDYGYASGPTPDFSEDRAPVLKGFLEAVAAMKKAD